MVTLGNQKRQLLQDGASTLGLGVKASMGGAVSKILTFKKEHNVSRELVCGWCGLSS